MSRREVYEGGEEQWGEPPVSRAEQLMKAHPDITVIRDWSGEIFILQTFKHNWRHIHVDVTHEEESQQHYPTVLIRSYDTPINGHRTNDEVMNIRKYGLTTVVKVLVNVDEQVTPEVEYGSRVPYPHTFPRSYIDYFLKEFSHPVPAQELVASARIGLEMLKAYREASPEQQVRIKETFTGYHGHSQICDTTRPDMDEYIAEVSPLFANAIRRSGFSLNHVGTKSIYALNALNKVTNAMLPSEMPPVPPNRREPRRRVTSGVSPVPGRRAAGR